MFTVLGAESSGAAAQREAGAVISGEMQAPDQAGDNMAETPETTASGVRFVAEPVVQPLPGDADSGDGADAANLPDNVTSLRELVSDMPTGGKLSGDMRCLAQAIYFEARGEPLAGQLAVGRVVVNRAESNLFPDDYCGVVTQRKQFSFVKNGHIPAVNTTSAAWQRAKAIARIAHQELWQSEARDALYFHAKRVHPRWATRKIARATIDSHIFYR